MSAKFSFVRLLLILSLGLMTVALPSCGNDDDDTGNDDDTLVNDDDTGNDDDTVTDDDDTGPPNPERPNYYEWNIFKPEDAVCGLGSEFKFWINYAENSDNVLVYFEPGGACWKWDMCSPEGGSGLGAANKEGVTDTYVLMWDLGTWLFRRDWPDVNPTWDWNYVFIPYCTGDVHTGNAITTYEDPRGIGDPVTFYHQGYNNMTKVLAILKEKFPRIDKLFVSGSSAGGFGSNLNFYRLRDTFPQASRAYLMNDSGPIFDTTENTEVFFDTVTDVWNLASIIPEDCVGCLDNYGLFHDWLAQRYPDDRLSTIVFRRDFNVSRFYFEFFLEEPTKANILAMFWDHLQLMMDRFDKYDNLQYYIPYWRHMGDSHTLTTISPEHTDIPEANITLPDWIRELLNDDPAWGSLLESVQPGEDEE